MPVKLIELEDLPYFPHFLRKMQMDFIGSMVISLKVYKPVIPLIQKTLEKSHSNAILDLCSGSGKPIIAISKDLGKVNSIYLSDLFPNREPLNSDVISWINKPVNALEKLEGQEGVRTIFNAYHHFDDSDKAKFLRIHAPQGIFIAEILQPNLITFIKIFLTTTIGQLLFCPFIKPFSWKRLLFTYVIPINLFTITWDGLVSVVKSQKVNKMQAMARSVLKDDYNIESGEVGPFYARVSWLSITKKV